MLVPGFAAQFEKWVEASKDSLSKIKLAPSVQFNTKDHWLNKHAMRIPMRAGSLVVRTSSLF